ncbi:uncharacterized protein LOC120430632 [Culex pipiens pallens]|uniref:uncharacterized protein LOC120430632 n=1 Tax=Culex pipiens pallens TaxID=42434 RepID=UPI00195325DC|nr:uncharacterized protein LOC120430632 [Culex pipiens pallens]
MADSRKLEFLKTILPSRILAESKREDEELVQVELTTPDHLDGFMSTIHRLVMVTRNKSTGKEKTSNLMVKVMKGDESFRESCLSPVQFRNEIFIYTKVVPCFQQLLESSSCSVKGDKWCPRVVFGVAGKVPEYSDCSETILVMENIALEGFKAGPRNDLDEEHLLLMARNIAQFHACTYAMKITKDPRLGELVKGIIPFDFVSDGKVLNSYALFFKMGLDRLFEYLDNNPKLLDSERFKNDISTLRSRYGEAPIHLMQKLLHQDEFSVILHGDYNRNNVLFKYENDKPVDIRMFDFQENRYGTPAIDLIFFMCMSMPTGLRERFWYPLLEQYHGSLMSTLQDILKCDANDPRLKPYSYQNFKKHLQRYGMYGGMIAVHFLPWMICPEEECAQLAFHFANDMYSPEMKHWLNIAGGDVVDIRLTEVFRHLSVQGYMDIVHED